MSEVTASCLLKCVSFFHLAFGSMKVTPTCRNSSSAGFCTDHYRVRLKSNQYPLQLGAWINFDPHVGGLWVGAESWVVLEFFACRRKQTVLLSKDRVADCFHERKEVCHVCDPSSPTWVFGRHIIFVINIDGEARRLCLIIFYCKRNTANWMLLFTY